MSTSSPDVSGEQIATLRLDPLDLTLKYGRHRKPLTLPRQMFVSPAKQIGKSGGTAPFFALQLQPQELGKHGRKSAGHYIGKDLDHARDEQGFYVDSQRLLGAPGWEVLGDFMIEFAGVHNMQCIDASNKDLGMRELLVLRNLFDSKVKTRLLDIKIGKYTADGGWMGKSQFAAFRNNTLDMMTNSMIEGYRLEGFDGIPSSLESFDPLEGMFQVSAKKEKKARRLQFQSLPAKTFLTHFLDTRPDKPQTPIDIQTTVSPTEYSEAILRALCLRMGRLCHQLSIVPVPQKWIASSIALGFDAGVFPTRGPALQDAMDRCEVCMFDWGRSELLSPEAHGKLSSIDKKDRMEFWAQYRAGALRLYYELARAYFHRYTNVNQWTWVRIKIYDFDSGGKDDDIGYADVPLQDTGGARVFPVHTPGSSQPLLVNGIPVVIEVAISLRLYPKESEVREGWVVKVGGVNILPNLDKAKSLLSKVGLSKGGSASDGFFTVAAMQKSDAATSVRQPLERSHCIINDNSPRWDETFEFCTMARQKALFTEVFGSTSPVTPDEHALAAMFPPVEADRKAETTGFESFLRAVGIQDEEVFNNLGWFGSSFSTSKLNPSSFSTSKLNPFKKSPG